MVKNPDIKNIRFKKNYTSKQFFFAKLVVDVLFSLLIDKLMVQDYFYYYCSKDCAIENYDLAIAFYLLIIIACFIERYIILLYRFSTSHWYDENGKVLRRYPTNEEIDKSLLTLFTKVRSHYYFLFFFLQTLPTNNNITTLIYK